MPSLRKLVRISALVRGIAKIDLRFGMMMEKYYKQKPARATTKTIDSTGQLNLLGPGVRGLILLHDTHDGGVDFLNGLEEGILHGFTDDQLINILIGNFALIAQEDQV